MNVVLASGNAGKLQELNAVLAPLGVTLRTQRDLGISDAEETAITFVENALIKARHAAGAGNMPAIADDSGLVVPALGGAPGVLSARYAGAPSDAAANNRKLIAALAGVADRRAYFLLFAGVPARRGRSGATHRNRDLERTHRRSTRAAPAASDMTRTFWSTDSIGPRPSCPPRSRTASVIGAKPPRCWSMRFVPRSTRCNDPTRS